MLFLVLLVLHSLLLTGSPLTLGDNARVLGEVATMLQQRPRGHIGRTITYATLCCRMQRTLPRLADWILSITTVYE